jgi:hypothetical protein
MRTLPPPCSCWHAAPQRTPRSATVYSASCGGPPSLAVYLSCNNTVLHDQPPRCTTVSYTPSPSSSAPPSHAVSDSKPYKRTLNQPEPLIESYVILPCSASSFTRFD